MSVKVKTVKGANFGKTINFSGEFLKFDRTGIAEVKNKEIADKLVANFKGWLYHEGQSPVVEKVIKEVDSDNSVYTERVRQLEEKVVLRESTIKTLEKELSDWKEQVNLYKGKYEECEIKLSDYKTVDQKVLADLEIENKLLRKSVTELQTMCKELSIEEAKYKGLNKDKLIELILKESK